MKRTLVDSSSLLSVGYDMVKSILEVRFSNGSVYQYFNVPESLYKKLMNATSMGRFFNAFIRDRGYEYRLISK